MPLSMITRVPDRAGELHTFDTLNHFFLMGRMIIVRSNYWNIGLGPGKGEVVDDEEVDLG